MRTSARESTVAGLSLRHSLPLNGHVISVPAIADGKIYVGSSIPGTGTGGGTLYRIDRVFVGTGNAIPDTPLPDAKYGSGLLALDATTGSFKGFFQPSAAGCYRPDDDDADVPCPPTLFSRPGQDVVTFGSKMGAVYFIDPATMNVLVLRQLLPLGG
jgi:PQQ-like domain